ncbi:hypothetical protein SBBP2_570064 [Burkholderiales bacterium]|nr:hypothetical protein SBBP2_570064 [Burkholderiales bacterium]
MEASREVDIVVTGLTPGSQDGRFVVAQKR